MCTTMVDRRLGPESVEAIKGLGLDLEKRYDLCAELGASHAIWLGLWDQEQLLAVHRAIQFGPYLHLKGLFVAARHRGGPAGLLVARATLAYALGCGSEGVLAWIEPSKPDRALAERLRISPQGPLVHRFGLVVPNVRDRQIPLQGTGVLSSKGMSLETNLLGRHEILWTMDRDRLILSAAPVGDPNHLLALVGDLAYKMGARQIEFPIVVADLGALITTHAAGARRLSRATVFLGCTFFRKGEAN